MSSPEPARRSREEAARFRASFRSSEANGGHLKVTYRAVHDTRLGEHAARRADRVLTRAMTAMGL